MAQQQLIALKVAAAISATDTGAAVDVRSYTGNGYISLISSATGGAGQTSTVKIQDSDDGSTGWADTGVVFTAVDNTAASVQDQYVSLDGFRRYVRAVNTLAGSSPTVTYAVTMRGIQHQK
jgi:hypothetical protein